MVSFVISHLQKIVTRRLNCNPQNMDLAQKVAAVLSKTATQRHSPLIHTGTTIRDEVHSQCNALVTVHECAA